MNNIITDIKALQEETLLNLQSSKANNTVRAYKSDFNDFSLFCVKNGLKSLPSDPKIVSLYLTYLSKKEVKMSTLKRRLVSIGVIHRLKGYYLDTKHPSIIENIMGIKRRKGSIQKGKKPLLINNLKQIINVIDENNNQEIKKFSDGGVTTKTFKIFLSFNIFEKLFSNLINLNFFFAIFLFLVLLSYIIIFLNFSSISVFIIIDPQ